MGRHASRCQGTAQTARLTNRPAASVNRGTGFRRLTGRGSGLRSVYDPQHGHGRLSMAAVSYTVQEPTSGHEWSHLPHDTVQMSTVKTSAPSLSQPETRGTRSTPGRSSG